MGQQHKIPGNIPASLQQALDLSAEMISAARDEQWERMMELELQRRRALNEGVNAVTADELAQFEPVLVELSKLNDDMMALCGPARNQVASKLDARRTSDRAQSAYGRLGKKALDK